MTRSIKSKFSKWKNIRSLKVFWANVEWSGKYNMKIAIWGTGKFGRYIYKQLKSRKGNSIVAWVDSDLSIVGTKIDGVPVISP